MLFEVRLSLGFLFEVRVSPFFGSLGCVSPFVFQVWGARLSFFFER